MLLSVQDGQYFQGRIYCTLTGKGGLFIEDTNEKRYNIIYADPPWQYRVYSKKGAGRSAESHYPTMQIEEIRALPVERIAAENCALFLWLTFPNLRESLTVLDAWGFTYKTIAFVWVKLNKKAPTLFWGMGYWTRANVELCLLATRGRPRRQCAGVHQVIMAPVEQHSKKPDIVREKIVALMGDLPRVELFARQATPGWDVWGNEVESDLSLSP
ncbi:N6-adenosine-specific RNA methylase IME4 [Lachnospiraceae bacterium NLAE-zl-G231]|nr:N6-adenosine-specific RNA methylase IME4 [Lachnospiraceae bacterium NLAE-zl-G231]